MKPFEWSESLQQRERDKEGRLELIGLGDEHTGLGGDEAEQRLFARRRCSSAVEAIERRTDHESRIGAPVGLCREQLTVLPKFPHKLVSGLMQERGDVVVQRVHVLHQPLVRFVVHL